MPIKTPTHTPKPWTRQVGERFKHDNSAGIKGADGLYVAAALDFNRFDRDEEVEANALIIAASLDMLESCSILVDWIDSRITLLGSVKGTAWLDSQAGPLQDAYNSAKAALEKAGCE